MHPISPPAYQPACLLASWTLHHLGQITSLEIIHHLRGKVLKVCPQHEHRTPQPGVEMQKVVEGIASFSLSKNKHPTYMIHRQ